jgi:hypothetical protein
MTTTTPLQGAPCRVNFELAGTSSSGVSAACGRQTLPGLQAEAQLLADEALARELQEEEVVIASRTQRRAASLLPRCFDIDSDIERKKAEQRPEAT